MNRFFYRHGALAIGLVPVLVYCLSCLLFEANAASTLQIKSLILENVITTGVKPELLIAEYKARILWQCSSLLSVCAYILAIVWSCALLYRCCQSGAEIKKIAGMGSIIVVLTVLQILKSSPSSAMYNAIFNTTYETLGLSALYDSDFQQKVYLVISLINLLAAMAPVFILVAVCSTFSFDENEQPVLDFFADRVNYLKQGITAGSIILLFGIIHMAAWMQWPQALMGESAFAKTFLEYVHANSQFWGISFTLLLLSLYITATAALKSRALEVLSDHPGLEDEESWLKDTGFTISFQKHALQLGMMLTPTLAGSFGSVFELL